MVLSGWKRHDRQNIYFLGIVIRSSNFLIENLFLKSARKHNVVGDATAAS
jgi:hypothetical protein